MYRKIARWYKLGLWNGPMVRTAAEKGLITWEEYREITGEESLGENHGN